tara:strand:- start:2164 stop:3414 length:1251 start_codon:yes stop_codon:yes gene_type:complete
MSTLHQDNGPIATGQKVCIATTSYDNPTANYTFSIQNSREALHNAGIQTAYYLLQGNCHVDDSRNRIMQEFLLSDCTELVFLDSDVSWQAADLVKLCQYDEELIGAVYPFKRPDKKGDMPVRMMPGKNAANGLLEVEGLPTGFLRMSRNVIETVANLSESFNGNNGHATETPLMFQRTLIDGTRWGGDLNFCNLWRETGGRVMCDPEIKLGHTARVVFTDSLGAFMRRNDGTTLSHVCDKIKAKTWTVDDITEVLKFDDNEWSCEANSLVVAIKMAESADGPIIETGSGISTVLMAAATNHTVYCLEHSEHYAERLRQLAHGANVHNIGLCLTDLVGGWYELTGKTLPSQFAFGLNDGPLRVLGDRRRFMDVFGDVTSTIMCDDTNEHGYKEFLKSWANDRQKEAVLIHPRSMVIK